MQISLRRTLTVAALGLTLLLPAAAQAHSASASSGGVKATLSYTGGPGITAKHERLTILRGGKTVYDRAVPASGCFKVCAPSTKRPVALASLYGGDGEDVVLNLWNGGADCCTVADVYVPSAAMGSYVLDSHNFGEAGYTLRNIGPHGRPLFVSANSAYYCSVTFCAASALPLQIVEFEAEKFVDVTRSFPKLIARDAARWLKLYDRNPKQGEGALAAWAGDEYLLGPSHRGAVQTFLRRQRAERHLTLAFVKSLDKLLAEHP